MYMPGRLRTASRPSNLSILEASYFSVASGCGTTALSVRTSGSFDIKIRARRPEWTPGNHPKSIGKDPKNTTFICTFFPYKPQDMEAGTAIYPNILRYAQ